jgi:hypothetical protein
MAGFRLVMNQITEGFEVKVRIAAGFEKGKVVKFK